MIRTELPLENGETEQLVFALTVEEAANVARVSRSTIYLALRSGTLTARKAGRRTIICPSDLQRFIDGLPLFPGRASEGGE